MRHLLTALAFIVLAAVPAFGQGSSGQVRYTGTLTPGHAPRINTATGIISDGGGAAGSAIKGANYLSEIGITNPGLSFCMNDALTNASTGYHAFCIGPNPLGTGVLLTYDAYGGAEDLPCNFRINGTTIPCNASTSGTPMVASKAALEAIGTATYPNGVWRMDYGSHSGIPNTAPPLWYRPLVGTCVANSLVNDGGSCVNTTAGDGNAWAAKFPDGMIDIRQFGCIPDNSTACDAGMTATNVYAKSIGACTYVPAYQPGFKFTASIELGNTTVGNCLEGDRFKSVDASPTFADLNFTGTNGIVVDSINGFSVRKLAIKGDGATSTSSTETIGLYINNVAEGIVDSLYVSGFSTCVNMTAMAWVNPKVFCRDSLEFSYPNLKNNYPKVGLQLSNSGSGAAAATDISESVYKAASNVNDIIYTGDGSTTWFQTCAPFSQPSPALQPVGEPITCTGQAQSPMWRADGIKVWTGAQSSQPNGQAWFGPAGGAGGYKQCGVDYDVYDISASGGSGSGGTKLICGVMTGASITSGSKDITVSSLVGIANNFSCPTVCNVHVWADHGLPLAAKVVSTSGGNKITMDQASGFNLSNLTIHVTQIAVATGGSPNYSPACGQTTPGTCGYKLEVRFGSAPANDLEVNLTWQDPTGYAAIFADGVSDYIKIRPMHVGGYAVGLLHRGLVDGGITFEPDYIEILNQCLAIEADTNGDRFKLHRYINDPIPDCPGYVSPTAGPVTGEYNNLSYQLNGASNGGWNTQQTITPTGSVASIPFDNFAVPGPPLNGPYGFFELQCEGLTLQTNSAHLLIQFGQGSTPTWKTSGYAYGGVGRTSASATVTFDSTADSVTSGISVAGAVPSSSYYVRFRAATGKMGANLTHQLGGDSDTDNATTHTHYTFGGSYTADTGAISAIRLIPTSGNILAGGACTLRGAY